MQNTKTMTAKELLERPGALRKEIFAKEAKAYELRSLAEKCTAMLSPTPGGGHNDRKLEDLVVKAADLEAEVKQLEAELDAAVLAVTQVLAEMEDASAIRMLQLRYLELRPISALSEETHFSPRQVRRLLLAAETDFAAAFERCPPMPCSAPPCPIPAPLSL